MAGGGAAGDVADVFATARSKPSHCRAVSTVVEPGQRVSIAAVRCCVWTIAPGASSSDPLPILSGSEPGLGSFRRMGQYLGRDQAKWPCWQGFGIDRLRRFQIVEQLTHRRQQLIIRKNRDAKRRLEGYRCVEQLVLCVQKVDQRALTKLIFFLVGHNNFAIGLDLSAQSRNSIAGDGPRRPSFVDGLKGAALQARMTHRLFLITLGLLDPSPSVLSAAENIPTRDQVRAVIGALTKCRCQCCGPRASVLQRLTVGTNAPAVASKPCLAASRSA